MYTKDSSNTKTMQISKENKINEVPFKIIDRRRTFYFEQGAKTQALLDNNEKEKKMLCGFNLSRPIFYILLYVIFASLFLDTLYLSCCALDENGNYLSWFHVFAIILIGLSLSHCLNLILSLYRKHKKKMWKNLYFNKPNRLYKIREAARSLDMYENKIEMLSYIKNNY